MKTFSLNIKGSLFDLSTPKIMGILNVTPDSFYSGSRTFDKVKISDRVSKILEEGADIIDVGGFSTRPGYEEIPEEEEFRRVSLACEVVRSVSSDVPLSIDTFRASVAKFAIENCGANIINDISGGVDSEMFEVVGKYKVPYVLTHNPSLNISKVKENISEEKDSFTAEVITALSKSVDRLHLLGVNDVIIDPGFGFGKTIEENFKLLRDLDQLSLMGYPLLVGISRKSMIYKSLGISPEDALEGTVALNAWALEKGADILRVHDVKEAVQTVKLFELMKG